MPMLEIAQAALDGVSVLAAPAPPPPPPAPPASGKDVETLLTDTQALLGAIVSAIIVLLMMIKMVPAYMKDKYDRMATVGVVGGVLVWIVGSISDMWGAIGNTFDKVI